MYIGIDIGGSNIAGAVFSEDKEVVFKSKVKSKALESTDVVVGQLFKLIIKLTVNVDIKDIKSIGIGIASLVDSKNGLVKTSANINMQNFPLAKVVTDEFGVPAFLENDVNVGTIGEWLFGAGKNGSHENIVGVFVGTGVGGGLVLDGKVYTGKSGMAGEIGHMSIDSTGEYCSGCGSRGCMEAYSSKTGMEKSLVAMAKRGRQSLLIDMFQANNNKMKSSHLVKALEAGDEVANEVVDFAMEQLGVCLGSVLNLLNPSLVVFGGGVMDALGERLMPKVIESTSKVAMSEIFKVCEFAQASLGDEAGLYGAMDVAVQGLKR